MPGQKAQVFEGNHDPKDMARKLGVAGTEVPDLEAVREAQHGDLVHILTREDMRREKREGDRPNIYRMGLFLEALDRAEKHPKGIAEGLREAFEPSPLLDRMLRSIGPNPPPPPPPPSPRPPPQRAYYNEGTVMPPRGKRILG
jgi:hypothetical protein